MIRNFLFPIFLGLFGVTVLVSLGVWQLQRLEWKEEILFSINQTLKSGPEALPQFPKKASDQYLSVTADGEFLQGEVHVLTSMKFKGPGFRVIAPFQTLQGEVILVDRGFIKEVEKSYVRPLGKIEIVGNLLWPSETDYFTPDPDFESNIWFARNLEAMAEELNTAQVLMVLRETSTIGAPEPQPVGVDIPNNHYVYALTWFSMALVWFGMTLYFLWRIKNRLD